MAKFRFSMVVDGIERVTEWEIRDSELRNPLYENEPFTAYQNLYRHNTIYKYLKNWALSNITLSAEEVKVECVSNE